MSAGFAVLVRLNQGSSQPEQFLLLASIAPVQEDTGFKMLCSDRRQLVAHISPELQRCKWRAILFSGGMPL